MVGRTLDGRYRLQALVATGGMGRIYRAEQLGLGRTVAIKVLTVDGGRHIHDPRYRERFAREAAMVSRLTSPHTITLFHYGRTEDDLLYIAMEYVEGITLTRFLEREGRLSVTHAVTVAGQICMSLREAHARGIVHRDIKPSNIMLIGGDYDQVKVLDFGIAKQMVRDSELPEPELTTTGSYIGTPEYMAPECFDGRVESRSDIYSVGVVLYRMVTGRLPFKGKTATQTIRMSLQDPVPPIDPALGLPRALEELLFACLEKDADRRPPSVDDVLYSLQVSCLEVESATATGQGPVVDIDVIFGPPETEAEPIAAPAPTRITSTPAAAIRRRRSPVKLVVGGLALLAIGGAVGLALRFTVGDSSQARPAVAPPAATKAVAPTPAAPPAPPAATTPAPSAPHSSTAGAAVVAPAVRPIEAAATAPGADETEDAEPAANGRRRRSAARPRNEGTRVDAATRGGSPAPAGVRQSGERSGSSGIPAGRKPTSPAPVPVPEGYKDSPY